MKRFLLGLIVFGMFSSGIVFAENMICGIGAALVKDPYNKRVFVKLVLPNSMAEKAGLPEGAEIISVNGKKVKKLNINQVSSLVRGEEGSTVKLTIKYFKKISKIEIPRGKFNIPEKQEDRFEIHWKQIAPLNKVLEPIPQNMLNSMSTQWYNEVVPFTYYWLQRKAEFKNGYNACLSYPVSEQNACLMNLTNREINKTAQDRQIELQKNIIRQQAIQNVINTFNQNQMNTNLQNINDNLRHINNKLMY